MPKTLDRESLNERTQRLLKLLIDHYICDGQPVGSRTLARDSSLDLSPATIRNIMADLEDMGLIRAPHTSAGRIPTARGYRMFVDSLLQLKPLRAVEVDRLRAQLRHAESDNQPLWIQTSNVLSDLTRMVGLVMLPKLESQPLRHVEFLPLSNRRVLVVMVLNTQEVQNRIIHTSHNYTPSELQQAANYLNEAFAGSDIKTVRQKLLQEMREVRDNMQHLMDVLMEMADKAFTPSDAGVDYVLSGQHHFMEVAEWADVEKLRELFELFSQKRDILNLLDQALDGHDMQIFIGEESGYEGLDQCTVITAPYEADGQVIGVLGVIGPTRMPYGRVIPIVDMTAKLVGSALRRFQQESRAFV